MHEYTIPTMHMRNQIGIRPRVDNSYQQQPSMYQEPLPNVTYNRPPSEKPQDNSVLPPQPQYQPQPQQPPQQEYRPPPAAETSQFMN